MIKLIGTFHLTNLSPRLQKFSRTSRVHGEPKIRNPARQVAVHLRQNEGTTAVVEEISDPQCFIIGHIFSVGQSLRISKRSAVEIFKAFKNKSTAKLTDFSI